MRPLFKLQAFAAKNVQDSDSMETNETRLGDLSLMLSSKISGSKQSSTPYDFLFVTPIYNHVFIKFQERKYDVHVLHI